MERHMDDLGHAQTNGSEKDASQSLLELAATLAEHWKMLVFGSLIAGLVALGLALAATPTFTATATFLPPQQQQSAANSVLSTLGSLAGLTGSSAALRTPADQYVALLRSVTVADRMIDAFTLMDVYDKKYRMDARKTLAKKAHFSIGKKDGLITIEVDDHNPQRAAEMANRYIDELRRMTDMIAVTEAQQRRKFFETQLQQTQLKLVQAQQALQASGLTEGTLKAEPKAAAEGYARLKAQVTAAEVRLYTLRSSLADNTPEVQQQQNALSALRSQLEQLEHTTDVRGGSDYVGKYREFKYQETLFDLFARQYEIARVDESREGGLIQVVDRATPPERKSGPQRTLIAISTTLVTGIALAAFVLMRRAWRRVAIEPESAEHIARLRRAFGRNP